MPSYTPAQQFIREIKTETVHGEVTLNINLSIVLKVEQDGSMHVSSKVNDVESEKTLFEIPDIDVSPKDLISFGKDVL